MIAGIVGLGGLALSTSGLAAAAGGILAGKTINAIDSQKERQFQLDKQKEQNRDYE